MLVLMKWIAFVLLVFSIVACTPQETGILEGHVSMNLQPVVQENVPEPTPPPEAYAVRQVVIFSANGKNEITRIQIDTHGNYQVTLPVGTYMVDINQAGMDRGIDLPVRVEIITQKVIRLDIAIDTGIR